MALYEYMRSCQRFLRDGDQRLVNPYDLISYINLARRRIAQQTQCIRALTPVSGQVATISVTQAGTGYTAPTVTISPPDFPSGQGSFPNGAQATAIATETGGTISNISVEYGGYGYFQPVVTITDPTGTGAVGVAQVSPITVTKNGKEVYPFSELPLSNFPGVGTVITVRSVSVIYANYRYSLPAYAFSTYQARVRQYPLQYQYVPTIMSQYGQGAAGSFYMYPLPSNEYQLEFDCICLPIDLQGDGDPEAIPLPWTDSIQFLATSYAYNELQNPNMARWYMQQYEEFVKQNSAAARPGRRLNPYGGF